MKPQYCALDLRRLEDVLFPFYLFMGEPSAYRHAFMYFYLNLPREHPPEAVDYIIRTLSLHGDTSMLLLVLGAFQTKCALLQISERPIKQQPGPVQRLMQHDSYYMQM